MKRGACALLPLLLASSVWRTCAAVPLGVRSEVAAGADEGGTARSLQLDLTWEVGHDALQHRGDDLGLQPPRLASVVSTWQAGVLKSPRRPTLRQEMPAEHARLEEQPYGSLLQTAEHPGAYISIGPQQGAAATHKRHWSSSLVLALATYLQPADGKMSPELWHAPADADGVQHRIPKLHLLGAVLGLTLIGSALAWNHAQNIWGLGKESLQRREERDERIRSRTSQPAKSPRTQYAPRTPPELPPMEAAEGDLASGSGLGLGAAAKSMPDPGRGSVSGPRMSLLSEADAGAGPGAER